MFILFLFYSIQAHITTYLNPFPKIYYMLFNFPVRTLLRKADIRNPLRYLLMNAGRFAACGTALDPHTAKDRPHLLQLAAYLSAFIQKKSRCRDL